MLDKLGVRKLIVTLLCLGAGLATDLCTDRGLSTNLLTLMISIVGMYNGFNVLNKKIAPKGEDQSESDSQVTATVIQLEQNQSQIVEQLITMAKQVELANKKASAALTVLNPQAGE